MILPATTRRFDLDWLRVLALCVLVFYHIGMFYVYEWGWHIKSEQQSVWLQDIMILTNQWRMSLLFLISSMVLSLTIHKQSRVKGVIKRSSRLLVPLLFGMFVIVAPQVYVEATDQGLIDMGFWSFWLEYINTETHLLTEHHSVIGLLTWNHLWFLPYLWCYTLLLFALSPILEPLLARLGSFRYTPICLVILAVAVMSLIWLNLRREFPVTHDLITDWYSHAKYFWVCVLGYLFARLQGFTQFLQNYRRVFLVGAVLLYGLLIADRHDYLQFLATHFDTSVTVRGIYALIVTGNHWCWLFAILGYASRYLSFNCPKLDVLNKGVMPSYMVHQTVIVLLAYGFTFVSTPIVVEVLLIVVLTFVSCGIAIGLAKSNKLFGVLLGYR